MAGKDNIEKGDKVAWNWGGSAPGGKVTEKKEHGEVAIKSHRGNTIKKNAEPNDPAVKIARSGNDVVKKASELQVKQKASGNRGQTNGSKKRDNQEVEQEYQEEKDSQPKTKKQKAKTEETSAPTEKRGRGRPRLPEGQRKTKPPVLGPNGEKRGRGRPRKDGSSNAATKTEDKKATKSDAAKTPGKRGRKKKA